MSNERTVFSQILDFIPKHQFRTCVNRYGGKSTKLQLNQNNIENSEAHVDNVNMSLYYLGNALKSIKTCK